MLNRPLHLRLVCVTPLLIAGLAGAGLHAEDQPLLAFVDLRAQAGVAANSGRLAELTLMAGDIGDKSAHVIDVDSSLGIVIGVRGVSELIPFARSPDGKVHLYGGELLGGIGIYAGKEDHIEVVAGYGKGYMSFTDSHTDFHKDGDATIILGEIGWFHTFDEHYQLGITAGWATNRMTLHGANGANGDSFKSNGINATLAVGYRF
ncbi:MAG: hypothetical protein H0X38_16325 [Planctomycetes bacterium]|nr:hypothetical protein [Planctomycetota bacterium]